MNAGISQYPPFTIFFWDIRRGYSFWGHFSWRGMSFLKLGKVVCPGWTILAEYFEGYVMVTGARDTESRLEQIELELLRQPRCL